MIKWRCFPSTEVQCKLSLIVWPCVLFWLVTVYFLMTVTTFSYMHASTLTKLKFRWRSIQLPSVLLFGLFSVITNFICTMHGCTCKAKLKWLTCFATFSCNNLVPRHYFLAHLAWPGCEISWCCDNLHQSSLVSRRRIAGYWAVAVQHKSIYPRWGQAFPNLTLDLSLWALDKTV